MESMAQTIRKEIQESFTIMKFLVIFIVIFNFNSCFFMDYFYEDEKFRYELNKYVSQNASSTKKLILKVEDFTDYDWDYFFRIWEYSSLEEVQRKTKVDVKILGRTDIESQDGINALVFVKNGKLLKYVLYPRKELDFFDISEEYNFFSKRTAIFRVIECKDDKDGYPMNVIPVNKID